MKEAVVKDERLTMLQRLSKNELACFLAMLCDFYWTQGEDNWLDAPSPPTSAVM